MTATVTPSKHFSATADEYLREIETAGRKIEGMGVPRIWQTVQQWANQGIHPGAIAEVLSSAIPYLPGARNKQGYLRAMMQVKSQNWREKVQIKEHEKIKMDFSLLVDRLRQVYNS